MFKLNPSQQQQNLRLPLHYKRQFFHWQENLLLQPSVSLRVLQARYACKSINCFAFLFLFEICINAIKETRPQEDTIISLAKAAVTCEQAIEDVINAHCTQNTHSQIKELSFKVPTFSPANVDVLGTSCRCILNFCCESSISASLWTCKLLRTFLFHASVSRKPSKRFMSL